MDETSQKELLDNQIRVAHANVFWTHKAHAKSYDSLISTSNCWNVAVISLSTLITSSALWDILDEVAWLKWVSCILAGILTGFTTYLKAKNYGELIHRHKQAADSLWAVREDYLSLLYEIKADLLSVSQIIDRRDTLQTRVMDIYKNTPSTTEKGYNVATKAIKTGDATFTNEELNLVVPPDLRK